jgi:hypothetical protein
LGCRPKSPSDDPAAADRRSRRSKDRGCERDQGSAQQERRERAYKATSVNNMYRRHMHLLGSTA